MDGYSDRPQLDDVSPAPDTREAQVVTAAWVRDAREERGENAARDEDHHGSRWWWLAGLAVLLAGIGVVFALRAAGGAPPAEAQVADTLPLVETVAVVPEGRGYAIEEEGFLRPRAEVDVVAELAGRIGYVSPKLIPGGRFEAGEVLFRLDARDARAQLSQARANLDSARAQLEQANADDARQQRLAEIGAVATAQAEQSAAGLASARAAVAQGEAQVEIAAERLEDTEVTAPFSATVMRESAALGAYVSPGQVVARLFDNAAAEVPLGLAPADAAAVRRAVREADGPLIVRVEPTVSSASTRTLYGEVAEIARSLDPQARTVQVTIRVDDAFSEEGEGEVYAQDFVEVILPAVAARPLYAAPAGVLRKDGYVWTVEEEGGEAVLVRVDVEPVRFEEERVVFAADADLTGRRLVQTALTEEAAGMRVRTERAEDRDERERQAEEGPPGSSGGSPGSSDPSGQAGSSAP